MKKPKRTIADLTRVRLTNLDKVLYPAVQVTKGEIITYYIRMAPRILPFVMDRPLTLHRYPEGIDGEDFYEKDAPPGTPGYVDIFTRYSKTADRDVHFVLCNNLDTLIWLANLASLELHISLSRTMEYTTPDLLLFDIDPEPPLSFDDVIEVAHIVKGYLEAAGIQPYVKTSGRKGVHIVVPLVPGYRFEEVRSFAHDRGKEIAKETPHVVAEFPRSQEPGTIFIDYLQNANGKTMAAPYSLRGTPVATVSAPVRWDELKKGVRAENFNIRTILPGAGDPWRGILEDRQKI
ncbi:MAG: non-homologous end-joining DNA ligase [Methanoregula sp.]|nr:non-homologous end-joining DNA ligase [Methanoregula sp.]